MARVALSYDRSDTELIRRLVSVLEAKGHDVWWDREIAGGDSFRDVIDRELDRADIVVVLWSPESVRSNWVVAEADHAERLKKLLPVKTAGVKEWQIPKPFGALQTQDVSDESALLAAIDFKVSPDEESERRRKRELQKAKDASIRKSQASAETEIRTYLIALLLFLVAGTGLASYWGGPPYVEHEMLKATTLLIMGAILTIGAGAYCFSLGRHTRNPVYSAIVTMTASSIIVFVWLGLGAVSVYYADFGGFRVTLLSSVAIATVHLVLLESLRRGASWVFPATRMMAVVQLLALASHETYQIGWWIARGSSWFTTDSYAFLHLLYQVTHVSGVAIAIGFLVVSARCSATPVIAS